MYSTVQMRTFFSLGRCVCDVPKLMHTTVILRRLVLVCFLLFSYFAVAVVVVVFPVQIASDKHNWRRSKKGCDFLTRVFAFHLNGGLLWLWKSLLFEVSLSFHTDGAQCSGFCVCVFCLLFFFYCYCSLPLLCNVVQWVCVCVCVDLESYENSVGCELGLTIIQPRNEMTIMMTKKKTRRQKMPMEVWSNNWMVEGERCSGTPERHWWQSALLFMHNNSIRMPASQSQRKRTFALSRWFFKNYINKY